MEAVLNTNSVASSASTGVSGLDLLLKGGFPINKLHLIQGHPGTGKTTLAMQFLLAGVSEGEPGLFISFSESFDEITQACDSHDWSLEGLTLFDLSMPDVSSAEEYTIFLPAEVELGATIQRVIAEVQRVKPKRVVFDSLSELRLLASDSRRFRQQILALKKFFATCGCTVLMLDDNSLATETLQLQTLCHGVIQLQNKMTEFGSPQRKLRIVKMRGVDFRGSEMDFEISKSGAQVYDCATPRKEQAVLTNEMVKSGVKELDELFGGGPFRGTSTLLLGPSGAGKSSIASLYASTAASRGEKVAFYIFEESLNTFQRRVESMNFGFRKFMDEGLISVIQMDPAGLSLGKFSDTVREAVDAERVSIVVIDSLSGYLNSMIGEKLLLLHLHDLLAYCSSRLVTTFITVAQAGFVGVSLASPVEVSYLSDSVLLFRFFEVDGKVRRALSVAKKRDGAHEDTIRELQFTSQGPRVGAPLTDLQGVLTGFPLHIVSASVGG